MSQDPWGSKNCYPLSGTVTLESNRYTHELTQTGQTAGQR